MTGMCYHTQILLVKMEFPNFFLLGLAL
jgi:hypothetical protein